MLATCETKPWSNSIGRKHLPQLRLQRYWWGSWDGSGLVSLAWGWIWGVHWTGCSETLTFRSRFKWVELPLTCNTESLIQFARCKLARPTLVRKFDGQSATLSNPALHPNTMTNHEPYVMNTLTWQLLYQVRLTLQLSKYQICLWQLMIHSIDLCISTGCPFGNYQLEHFHKPT